MEQQTTPDNEALAYADASGKFRPALGSRITSLRILRKLSYADLAEKVGVTEQTVRRWEREWLTPEDTSMRRLKAIADAVGLDVRALTQQTEGFLILMHTAKLTRFGVRKLP